MENKHTSITFKAKVKPIKPVNPEFDLVKVYVQGVGKNRNGSYMSKSTILSCLPSLNYCPVVGHLIEYTDNEGNKHRFIGGHDWEITEDWEIRDLTVPYGVVVEDSYDWEVINEYGKDVEYLTANAILWTGRYPELKDAIYSDGIWFNQSMELNIPEGKYRPLEEDSNYTELLEWTYSALCLLGKADKDSTNGHTDPREHTEPAFISARVIPLEFSKSEFAEAMNEMKEKLSFCFKNQPSTMEVDIDKNNGGSTMTEEIKNEVVDEMAETVVEENVDEAVEETVEEVVEEVVEETTDEPTDEVVEDTVEAEVEEVTEEVVEETTEDETVVEESNEDFSVLYAELKEKYDALESEIVSLRAYKESKEAEERQCAEDSLFADYEETIGETEEFKALKEKASEFSLDALKKECLCIVGMYSMTNKAKETKKTEPLKFSLEPKEIEDEPYGGLMKKYLRK